MDRQATDVRRTLLGTGRLDWPRGERVGDRYGIVTLGGPDWEGRNDREAKATFADAPGGKHGALVAEVIETRQSTHIGDLFNGWFPATPEVGEVIRLGVGTLFTEVAGGDVGIGVRPGDGRDTRWMDGPSLYRCHSQTVRLYFEPDQ